MGVFHGLVPWADALGSRLFPFLSDSRATQVFQLENSGIDLIGLPPPAPYSSVHASAAHHHPAPLSRPQGECHVYDGSGNAVSKVPLYCNEGYVGECL